MIFVHFDGFVMVFCDIMFGFDVFLMKNDKICTDALQAFDH